MDATAYHCQLAWLGDDHPSADVLIEIDGDRIVTVTPGVDKPQHATALPGLTMPGLANSHSHAFHRALRGRTHDGVGSFWTWREQMYELAATLEPQTYHRLARAVFAEMALAGVTCVGEFHYLHHQPDGSPYADPNVMGASLISAAADAGIRITLLDACYLHGGIDQPPNEVQQRFSDVRVDLWGQRVELLRGLDSPTVRIGAAIHSVRAVDPEAIQAVAAWAIERQMQLHAHVSEQPSENHDCVQAYALTPTELLAERSALEAAFTAVHATHLTDHDMRLLATHGSTVCLCPTTERDLADGIGPTVGLAEAGVAMSLGSDSHAVIDLFEEARALELDERLVAQVRGNHLVTSLLTAATVNGHRCLGWPDAGRLAVGNLADLVTIDLGSVRTAGSAPAHALATAVFAATAADVRHVVVGGRVVVADGRHVSIDVAAELADSIDAVWAAVT
ncbi:MAG: formiminoglutamate deiminase [Ilumatobacteraceae bacterium]|nr:formiminoglutamate deiminase [Ilumatobacteraceae bacterium]